jgi:hypothetical protein
MHNNATAFNANSVELAGSLSTLYGYDYENMTSMLTVLSTQLVADSVIKKQLIAKDNVNILKQSGSLQIELINRISTVSTNREIIKNFLPLFNPLYQYISNEYFFKNTYTSFRRIYEQQSYYKVVPPSTIGNMLNSDDFKKVKYTYDLLIQEVNSLVDGKKMYVSTIFKPQLEYIVRNTILEDSQLIYLNNPTSFQINSVEYIMSSILPLSVSYIYVPLRQDLFSDQSLIPTTTRDVCLSTFYEVSTLNVTNAPNVVLRNITDVAPTTTLDT